MLTEQGQLILPGANGLTVTDLFQNPLLFLLPALGIMALSLLLMRLLPILFLSLAWLFTHTRSVSFVLALRYLARTSITYTIPLLMLTVTFSLFVFTASLARTLENHLHDQSYYRLGAELRLIDFDAGTAADGGQKTHFFFYPHHDYLQVPGLEAVSRVARYRGSMRLADQSLEVAFIGLDRMDFAEVAFWRADFAPESLGSLMNRLAQVPDGVLIPQAVRLENHLNIGDVVRVRLEIGEQTLLTSMTVVGTFDYFPTWTPGQELLLAGNLDYVFEQMGGPQPYQVWLSPDPAYETAQIEADLKALNKWVRLSPSPMQAIIAEQERPQRQGLFGVLSIGLMGAALLTMLGLLLYAFFSFRRRAVELGALRAVGLSRWQMSGVVIWEYVLLALLGLGAGTGLGTWASTIFIPYFQFGGTPMASSPPFVVEIAWPALSLIYGLFSLVFILALIVLIYLLFRMKLFEAIKLGEVV